MSDEPLWENIKNGDGAHFSIRRADPTKNKFRNARLKKKPTKITNALKIKHTLN